MQAHGIPSSRHWLTESRAWGAVIAFHFTFLKDLIAVLFHAQIAAIQISKYVSGDRMFPLPPQPGDQITSCSPQ